MSVHLFTQVFNCLKGIRLNDSPKKIQKARPFLWSTIIYVIRKLVRKKNYYVFNASLGIGTQSLHARTGGTHQKNQTKNCFPPNVLKFSTLLAHSWLATMGRVLKVWGALCYLTRLSYQAAFATRGYTAFLYNLAVFVLESMQGPSRKAQWRSECATAARRRQLETQGTYTTAAASETGIESDLAPSDTSSKMDPCKKK